MKPERGAIHIIFPDFVESYSPLTTVRDIDLAISVLGLCREIAKQRESDIPQAVRIVREEELLVFGGVP